MTTTDRELLERAAKAAGYSIRFTSDGTCFRDGPDWMGQWSPLEDDGDALRLMVRLNMNVFQAGKSAYALPSDDDGTYEEQVRYTDAADDPYAATRRAIVRAAAAMAGEGE